MARAQALARAEPLRCRNRQDQSSSVHSWLLQIGGKKILIDACCGNNKVEPARPFWHMLNMPYLERLCSRRRAAGRNRSA